MTISKILVAALLATAVGASAQDAGFDLQPMQKMETDGNTFNSNMDTNFTPPSNPAAKPAAKPAAIKLSGVTGTVQIKTAGGIMTVKAGEPVPAIPDGAEIVVIEGNVTVEAGGVTVKAGKGDSFTITPAAGSVSIAVTGGLVAVVDAKGVSKNVAKGEGVTVSAAPAATTQTTTTTTKTEEKKADENPESIPAETPDTTVNTTPTSSPTQESANTTTTTCPPVTSVSAPCP